MMLKFKDYLYQEENTVGVHNDGPGSGFSSGGGMAYVPSHYTDTETLRNHLASLDGLIRTASDKMQLQNVPLVRKESTIISIRERSNPIYVQLIDGTQLYFTRGQWERAGSPKVGNKIAVTLQRNINDNTEKPSQIQDCRII